jgi:hypothetical protein
MIAAHVTGMPVEELLPSLAGLVVARAWLAVGLSRRRERNR